MLPFALDLRSVDAVVDALARGTVANTGASCRRGSIDVVSCTPERPQRLIATGDLHDNPLHMARVVRAAGLDVEDAASGARAHLTMHELIHPDQLTGGLDFSYRVLARVAALKAMHPEHVHTLLANHELAQASGGRILKDGVLSVEAFDDGVRAIFPEEADAARVMTAVREFILSMPLALRMRVEALDGGDVVCAHSLPAPTAMSRFDAGVLERPLCEADYVAREGSAHLLVWGRGHTAESLEFLATRWNVGAFILGHEKAEQGYFVVPEDAPRSPLSSMERDAHDIRIPHRGAVVVNTDHARGVYLELVLGQAKYGGETHARAVPVSQI
jgi:hypothetical protein